MLGSHTVQNRTVMWDKNRFDWLLFCMFFHFYEVYTHPCGCYYVLLNDKCWVGLLCNSWASASVCVQLSCTHIHTATHTQAGFSLPVNSVSIQLWRRFLSLWPDEHSSYLPHTNKISSISFALARAQGLQSSFLLLLSFSSSPWCYCPLFFCNFSFLCRNRFCEIHSLALCALSPT